MARLIGILLIAMALTLTQWAFRFQLDQTPVDAFVRLLVCMADVLLGASAAIFLLSGKRTVRDALLGFPRHATVMFGLWTAFAMLLAVEFSSRHYFRNHYVPPYKERTDWYPTHDPRKAKGDTILHRCLVNDTLIYEVRYAIDPLGRRHVPPLNPDTAYRQFALLTGCSFMFGYGVDDSGTFARHIDSLCGLRAYNYAAPGLGPQHLLTLLRDSNLTAQVNEPNGRLIYLFIDDHIPRLIGSRRLIKMWARDFPYFYLRNGEVKQDGTFTTGRPILTAIYRILTQSAFIDLLDLDIPWWTSDRHLELATAVFAESQREFHRQFPEGEFLVIIGPNSQHAPRLIRFLDAHGIPFIDFSRLLDKELPEYRIHWTDEHPNGLYYQRIATELKRYFDEHPLP